MHSQIWVIKTFSFIEFYYLTWHIEHIKRHNVCTYTRYNPNSINVKLQCCEKLSTIESPINDLLHWQSKLQKGLAALEPPCSIPTQGTSCFPTLRSLCRWGLFGPLSNHFALLTKLADGSSGSPLPVPGDSTTITPPPNSPQQSKRSRVEAVVELDL